jgi:hypothetical protein
VKAYYFHSSNGHRQNARISDLDDLVFSVADVELTVDIASRAIVISSDSESVVAVAVNGINNSCGVDFDVTQVGGVLDKVHWGGKSSALGVGFDTDGEVEFVAACRNFFRVEEAEVTDDDSAVKIAGNLVTISGCRGIKNSVLVSHGNGGSGSLSRLNLNGHVKTVGIESRLKVFVVHSHAESSSFSVSKGQDSGGSVASVGAMGSKSNIIGKLSVKFVNWNILGSLSEGNNIQVARRRPEEVTGVHRVNISLIGSIESRQSTEVVAEIVGSGDGNFESPDQRSSFDGGNEGNGGRDDVDGEVSIHEFNGSGKVVASRFSVDRAGVGSKHGTSPVWLFSVGSKFERFNLNIANGRQRVTGCRGRVGKDVGETSINGVGLMLFNSLGGSGSSHGDS